MKKLLSNNVNKRAKRVKQKIKTIIGPVKLVFIKYDKKEEFKYYDFDKLDFNEEYDKKHINKNRICSKNDEWKNPLIYFFDID